MKNKTMANGKSAECVKNRHSGLSGIGCYCNTLKKKDSGQAGMTNKVITRSVSVVIMLLLLVAVIAPLAAFAVSYPPQLYHREVRHDKFVKGDTVYMFHSGTEDVKKTIHVNDTLAVYRITPSCEVVPIGVVKVISFVGETYIKGEVFAGEIKPDDIAKKGNVSCLIISTETCSK